MNQSFKGTSGSFQRRQETSMADTNWWWNLGTPPCSLEQKTVFGILPKRIITTQEMQNQSPCWKSHIDCILGLWRCCAYWLPGKRCYSGL